MQELIIYLLKSAGLMSLFYAGYYLLLKNDTCFMTNRFFLLAGIITSLLLPSLEITRTIEVKNPEVPLFSENFSAEVLNAPAVQPETIDWWQIAGVIYLIGLTFFLLKFFLELFSLLKLIFTNKSVRTENYILIQNSGISQPFSFFRYIVFDPSRHSPGELDLILKHEQAHVRQWHSVDHLLSSLSVYVLWFNPLCRLYRKSIVQNLEYLADKEVIDAQVSKKEYQQALLKICLADFQPALTNQFYQSFIKKRIMMLNKNTRQKLNFWKLSFLFPFLALFIFFFNVKTVAQEVQKEKTGNHVTSEIEISATISKNTSQKNLSQFKELFEKQGVTLEFKNIEYSKDDLLTGIQLSFYQPATGNSGNIVLNNPSGIEPTVFFTNEKETGFRSGEDPDKKKAPALADLGKEPLFIIAGKEHAAKSLLGKKIQVTGSMNVLKPKEAKTRYGKKAEDGAIILTEALIVDDIKEILKHMDLQKGNIKSTFIEVRKDSAPVLLSADMKVSVTTPSPNFNFSTDDLQQKPEDIFAVHQENEDVIIYNFQEKKPLIIVDGERKMPDFDASSIDPASIESINVLKDKKAVEKYGEAAKNGAIEIYLKSAEALKEEKLSSEAKANSTTLTVSKVKFEESRKISVRDVGSADPDASKPLYVIDGKVADKDFNPDSIAPENIKSITVLKGDKATAKYGEKGTNGVIEISLKEE